MAVYKKKNFGNNAFLLHSVNILLIQEALFNKQNNLRPKLKQYLNNVDEYDYIIVAGPIYFGEYPYEIYSLLDNLNLENKIIKPLFTHK